VLSGHSTRNCWIGGLIEEQLLFYTLEKDRKMWRFFDARTYRSGPFDQEYLASLMEQLI